MSTDPDADLPELPAGHDSVLGERERVAAALFGRDAQLSTIGRYRVEDVLGRGAMGVVYEAWDEQLQRTVAVKLIARDLEVGGAELRFRREALALGKLAHPNVVTVHEVGTHGGRLFIAMELVRGETLDAWFGAAERSWQDCLGVFVQAGRGLDAAHRAGLVHRDFKPANCIVGESGRVRVLDFGLARGSADLLDEDVAATAPAVSSLDVSVTRTGATVGTPAYMAPEQLRGGEVSAASDQFAFCVALYEALEGVRPFPGRSVPEIYENIEAGEMVAGSGRAPTEVVRIVERGLASSPTDRWPNLGELVDELEALPRRRARRRTVWSLAGVGVLAAAVAGAAWIPRDPCEDLPTTDVWSESRRATLKEALGDGPVWISLDRIAHDWVRGWDSMQQSSCEAARVDGDSNELTLGLQRSCLQRRESSLNVVLEGLGRAENPAQSAPEIMRAFPSLEDCGSVDALLRVVPPSPAAEAAVSTARQRLDESLASSLLGDERVALVAIRKAEALAQDVDYAPLDAEIALRRAWVMRYRAAGDALDAGHDALSAAETSAYDRLAADASIALVALNLDQDRAEDAARWQQIAEAKLTRIGAGPERRGRLAAQTARLGILSGELEVADSASLQALSLFASADGEESLLYAEALSERAKVVEQLGSPNETAKAYDASVEALRRYLGSDHPEVGGELLNRGLFRFYSGDSSGAERDFEDALPALEAGGASDLVTRLLVAKTQLETMAGPVDPAQVERIQSRYDALPDEHPEKETAAALLGSLYLRLDEPNRALSLFSAILQVHRDVVGLPPSIVAIDQSNVGECLLALGRLEDATQSFEAALSTLEAEVQPDDFLLAYPLGGVGRVLVQRGQLERARPHLERALELAIENPGDQVNLAHVRASLAQTLPHSPRRDELTRLSSVAFRDLGIPLHRTTTSPTNPTTKPEGK